jgi:hypothetical protein
MTLLDAVLLALLLQGPTPPTNVRIVQPTLTEAYPVFTRVTPLPPVPGPGEGQHHGAIDWTDARLDLDVSDSDAMVDASHSFSVSMRSTSGSNITSDVTPRNVQRYHPAAGRTLAWALSAGLYSPGGPPYLQHGTVVVAADGTITIPSLTITATGVRLKVTSLLPADTDYSSLPYCAAWGSTMSTPEGLLSIVQPTTTVPASSNNFRVYLNGVPIPVNPNARGFLLMRDTHNRVYRLGLDTQWSFWDEGTFTNSGYIGSLDIDPLLAVDCRLPASASGSVALQGNTVLVDSQGGIWGALCSEEGQTFGYGFWCPDFSAFNAGQTPGSILRNASFFPVPYAKHAMKEPNNHPWSLTYCNGEMYLLEYNANPMMKKFSKWAGPGRPWTDATGSRCLEDVTP